MSKPSRNPGTDAYAEAVRLYSADNLEAARQLALTLLAKHPTHWDARHLAAIIAARTRREEEAEAGFRAVIQAFPEYPEAHGNLASLLNNSGRLDEAEAAYREALRLNPKHLDSLVNLGHLLRTTQRPETAIAAYRQALELAPAQIELRYLLGVLLADQGQSAEAEAAYRQVIELDPNHINALCALGVLLKKLRRWEEAEAVYQRAIALNPDHPETLNNLANLQFRLSRLESAAANFERVLALRPDFPYALGMAANARAKMCDWSNQAELRERMSAAIGAGIPATPPFIFLSFEDDPGAQRRCAEIMAEEHFKTRREFPKDLPRYQHPKIRIAYLSADFHNHATAHLMAELFERHDRDRFEITGVSFGPDKQDAWRERLKKSFDRFLDVRHISNAAVADELRALEIDIAVDLKGYTQEARAEILALRPAPIQVNYLGYPGTMGVDFIDYVVADRFLIPEDQEIHYREKAVCLPDSYQCNTRRPIAETAPSRAELGLPEQGFVFCCFNDPYKLRPATFDLWMRLLEQVPDSVLWLLKPTPAVAANLRREAEARGVAAERLVFAARLPPAEHLARHARADLFLDSLPYNAHTTASDALWTGLPVLTLAGRAFASRVAGSLLRAVGLPELIATTEAEYLTLASRLATEPDTLAAIRRKLAEHRLSQHLFDADRFRRHIEAAYREMWEIWQRGEAPRAFTVAPIAAEAVNPDAAYAEAAQIYTAGRLEEARSAALALLATHPDHWSARHLLAIVAARTQREEEAETGFRAIIAAFPNFKEAYNNLATLLDNLGRTEEAIATYRQALSIDADLSDTWVGLGNLLAKTERYAEAEEAFGQALALAPDLASAHLGMAVLAQQKHQPAEAEALLRKVLELKPDYPEAHHNLGRLLADQARTEEAEAAYRQALALKPDHAEAHNGLGALLKQVGRPKEAEAAYLKARELDPRNPGVLYNLANLLAARNALPDAVECMEQLLRVRPEYPYALGMTAHNRAKLCDWRDYAPTRQALAEGIAQGKACSTPFSFMNLLDDPEAQYRCAAMYAPKPFPMAEIPIPRRRHARIRLAYISPDFQNHPVTHLMADLIERHDRSRFEVIAVSLGLEKRDEFRERLERAFDVFIRGNGLSDDALAERLRAMEIDIAVDLAGHTRSARSGLFARRVAPIQVNYLGYPGTLGVDYMDYILADRFVIPEAEEAWYAERVVRLPDTFQSTAIRRCAEHSPTRLELGLPEQGFVFCCFNNTYKIHPPQFDLWMRLLLRVEGSVLWLLKPHALVEENLLREAQARGVAPERLVFGGRLPPAQYLARYRQADLFLDTLPYNAGTTASDALWAGLPVLTRAGRAFAARMGGSLLLAAGLPELITESAEEYAAKAVHLATHPDELATLKAKLQRNRLDQPLFDANRFRVHIEAAYTKMWDIWRRGDSPRAFAVEPLPPTPSFLPPNEFAMPPQKKQSAPADAYNAIVCLYNSGRLEETRTALSAYLAKQPKHTDALNLLGVVAARTRRPEEAQATLLKLLADQPGHFEGRRNLAIIYKELGRFAESEAAYRQLLEHHPGNVGAYLSLGNLLKQMGRKDDALAVYEQALAARPDNPEQLNLLANSLSEGGGVEAALNAYQQALALKPDYPEALNNLGVTLRKAGRLEEAETAYRKALALKADYPHGWNNLGNLLRQMRKLKEAEAAYNQALALLPDYPEALNSLGIVLKESKRAPEAEAAMRGAIALKPDSAEFYNELGNLLNDAGRYEEAEAAYRKSLELNPNYAETYSNLGVLLKLTARLAESEAAYRRALSIRPNYADAYSNLGNLLRHMGRLEEAETTYRTALEIDPNRADVNDNLGSLYFDGKRWNDALACFERTLALKPDYPDSAGMAVLCRDLVCDWEDQARAHERLRQGVRAGFRSTPPWTLLNVGGDPQEQRQCAETHVREKYPEQPTPDLPRHRHDKIRIAYISPDLHDHPVAHLMADLIEGHDRSRFEITAVSLGHPVRDEWRARLEASFDRFIDAHGYSDDALAQRLRDLEIDIAVDLAGHTRNARTGIFARRAAPIQVNYIGHPGTLGANYIDYILADDFVMPPGDEGFFCERIARLPECFQSAALRPLDAPVPSRAELGLPEQDFVFCCFNNTYKIHPPTFDIWMRLLRQVPGSVLWLYQSNAEVERNLRREAGARGVDPARLVFGGRLPRPHYLARYRQADLFLDTLPYNAGTTASDALWMGLPVLTQVGRAFVSRMGGSLLRAAGLPELITDTPAQYEALALALATHPEELAALKAKLERNRATHPLFDVERFRLHIEAAYQRMWEIWQRGGAPENFTIAPVAERSESNAAAGQRLLHIGCGSAYGVPSQKLFPAADWRETRLDIAHPKALEPIATASIDAIFSTHSLQHLYPHQVPALLAEYRRVLVQTGYVLARVPDLQGIAERLAQGPDDAASALELIYGDSAALAAGAVHLAHRMGFTAASLAEAFRAAGFAEVAVERDGGLGLWAIAGAESFAPERLAVWRDEFLAE